MMDLNVRPNIGPTEVIMPASGIARAKMPAFLNKKKKKKFQGLHQCPL